MKKIRQITGVALIIPDICPCGEIRQITGVTLIPDCKGSQALVTLISKPSAQPQQV